MSKAVRVYWIAGAAVIAFDFVAATISHFSHYDYGRFYVGSWVLYTAVGILATRRDVSIIKAGALTGFIDASIGWWLALQLKPTTNTLRTIGPLGWALVALMVMISSVFFAGLGYVTETRVLYRIWPQKDRL